MVMILNRTIMRTLMANKAQYLSSFLLIMVSCLLFTTFTQLTGNMEKLFVSFKEDYALEDASFMTDKKLNNISELESTYQIRIEDSASFDYEIDQNRTMRVFAETETINRYAVTEGNKLSSGDILINPAYAKINSIDIGDSIKIKDVSFKVSGLMSLPNYIYPLKEESDLLIDNASFGIAVISNEDFTRFQPSNSFYSVKATGNADDKVQKLMAFKTALKDRNVIILKWSDVGENPRVTRVTSEIESINMVGSMIPIAILLLSCMLTGTVLWRMLQREAVMMGTLYAIGYTKSELMKHYLKYPLTIALSASIVGTILGAAALRPMLDMMTSNFNLPFDAVSYGLGATLISVLLPVLILLGTGYVVVRRGLRHSPVDLVRGGTEKRKIGWIEGKVKLDRLSFTNKFKVREQLRSITRSVFLLLGVAFATMLLLSGFTIRSSLDFLTNVDSVFKYEHEYVFNSFQQGPAEGDPFSRVPFKAKSGDSKGFIVYGISPETKSLNLMDEQGKVLNFERVIITKQLADRLKLKPGESIEMVGKLDSKTYSVTIDDIADSYIGENIYMPLEEFNGMLQYPKNSYMGIWSKEKVELSDDKLISTSSIDDIRKAYDSFSQRLQGILGITSIISFIIGLIVIFVVTTLIIEDNKETISLMKVLGYYKKEVNKLILNSSTYLVLLGFVLGIPLLIVSLSAMFRSVAESTSFSMPIKINTVDIFIGFAVVYLMYMLSKLLSRRKIQRITLSEALKSRME